jgi:hypothetical protein
MMIDITDTPGGVVDQRKVVMHDRQKNNANHSLHLSDVAAMSSQANFNWTVLSEITRNGSALTRLSL